MSNPTTTSLKALRENPPGWVTTLVLGLSMLTGGGGVGSAITGRSVSAEVTTLRTDLAVQYTEVKGKLDGLAEKVTSGNRQIALFDERLRLVEQALQQIKDIQRRVDALERKEHR